jgi:hypothetical protein
VSPGFQARAGAADKGYISIDFIMLRNRSQERRPPASRHGAEKARFSKVFSMQAAIRQGKLKRELPPPF